MRSCNPGYNAYNFAKMPANFSRTFATSSGLARATGGKSFSRSNGRQASITARELVELATWSNGSSGVDQARRKNSMSSTGSQRVHTAHITSKMSVGLTCVARIGLLDGDDVEHAGAAEFVTPNPTHPRQARTLDLIPDHPGLHHALAEREVRRRTHRGGDAEHRIVAVINAPHPHHRLLAGARRVIAGKFAERSLPCGLVRHHVAFDHHLGMRRHRQAMDLAFDHLIGHAAVAAGIIIFAQAEFQLVAAGKEQQRIMPATDQYRAWLAGAEIFLADLATMLAGRHP